MHIYGKESRSPPSLLIFGTGIIIGTGSRRLPDIINPQLPLRKAFDCLLLKDRKHARGRVSRHRMIQRENLTQVALIGPQDGIFTDEENVNLVHRAV